ncbi:MAG: tyrosine-type recombinase/integrase [Pseudomonadota bacterium]
METRHVTKLRDELDGHPANKRVKCLRYMFAWAVDAGHATRNPAKECALVRVASEGYATWTTSDVQVFEDRHEIGSKARLALAMFLYTGARKSDVVQLGPVNIRGDRLVFVQHKGREVKPKRRDIPLVAPLKAVLEVPPLGATTFLETEYGKPFSINGFGSWFRKRCDEAGLTDLSAHGLRKAVGVMAAERGCTAHQIMEILGHDTLEEAERYTRTANARTLGDAGFERLFGTEQE